MVNMESRNPMGCVYAENRSKMQKLLGDKGLIFVFLQKLINPLTPEDFHVFE